MHTNIVLFILLTLYSVAVSASLQEVLNVAKFIADIQQELPNSCVYIMNSEGEEQSKKHFEYISYEWCVLTRNTSRPLEKMCLEFATPISELWEEVFFVLYSERKRYGKINCIDLDKFFLKFFSLNFDLVVFKCVI